ncbi:MAG: VirB3 family type IV secretion system protein [Coxiellaceae bacterium]|nr:VirB3 family type IV secretion system protein [Coxiellaceae bacterium]
MEKLWRSPVYLALTRPAMMIGVTVECLSICFMFAISAFILTNSFRYLLLYFPLHGIGWIACKIDHHIFRLFSKRWECQPVPNKSLWGCQSYDAS